MIVSGNTSSVILRAPVAANSTTPLRQTFTRRGTVQFPGANETAQTGGKETFQSAGERTSQSVEEETRKTYESETVITTGEGGVQQITITGNRVEITQQVASAPSRPFKGQQEKVTSNQEERQRGARGIGGACASILSLRGTHDPEPHYQSLDYFMIEELKLLF